MEIIPTIISLATKIHELVKKDGEIEDKLKRGLANIKNELDMMNSVIMDKSSKAGAIDEQLVVKLQDLAYDVEDAIDLMVIDTNKTNKAPMHLGRVLRIVGIGDRRSQYILNIDDYQKRIDDLTNKWKNFFKNGSSAAASCPQGQGQPSGDGTSADAANRAASAVVVGGRHHLPPVGIEDPKKDIIDLLRHVDGHPVKLRVISIVGFRGVGKTTLAWAVFKEHGSLGEPPFDCQAWVQVAGQPAAAAHDESTNKSNAARLLKETLCQLRPETNPSDIIIRPNDDTALSYTILTLCDTIRTFLVGKRYLIVIDDVRHVDVWSEMKDAFPTDRSSRIIVTTGVQSVATECSLGGFVYRLRGLNEKDSDELLWKLVKCERHELPRDVQSHSGDIVRKCDGLPLALVGVAEYVRPKLRALRQGKLHCRDIARDLGMYLADGRYTAFQRARRALVDSYEGLDSHGLNLKTCLLSASMFPRKRGVRRKSLVRRWMAERLVHYDDKDGRPVNIVALEIFEELVDRIMILQGADEGGGNHPAVLVGEPGSTVKKTNKCSVHGVLLDFLLHESATKRFARLIRNGERLDVAAINSNPARRLAVVHDIDTDSASGDTSRRAKLAVMVNGLDLSRVRSLTVAGTVLSDSDLKGCKLLRVLDLDGCTGVTDGVLRTICKLKVLRYLSLRGTDARVLPPEMAELRFLETLDVRDIVMPGAEVRVPSDDVFTVTLPWDVLRLPYLKYLFGAFELPRDIPRRRSAPWTTAARASDDAGQLDTLAGLFIGNGRTELKCLETLLGQMNRLKKLKIWWKWNKKGVTAEPPRDLPTAEITQLLVKFLKKRCFDLDSLSLDFGDQSLDFLNFPMDIHVPCKLRSIKLRGKLSSLPGIIIKIPSDHALTKLYLSSTGLSCEALLVLQRLPYLTYLKLVENSRGDFTDGTLTLNAGGFPSLRGLHVQAPKLPGVEIVAGGEGEAVAMQHLTTLQLLCGDVSGFQAADIDRFHHLEQVVLLKSSLDEGATKAWEAARKNHMNRPRIDTV